MSQYAVAQGAVGSFRVLQTNGPDATSSNEYVCDSVISRGFFVFQSAEGVASAVSGNMAATAVLLGFIEQNVVADNSRAIDFGYYAQQKVGSDPGEQVAIWRRGRFFVTAVSGTVTAGSKIYPGDGGKVQGVQVGSAPALGYCVVGNNSVAGDPIEVSMDLIGTPSI